MKVDRRPTARGVRSILTYWYRGKRYRPVLGYNLTSDREREAAATIITAIHANLNQAEPSAPPTPLGGSAPAPPTFAEFVSTYLKELLVNECADFERNETALRLHLLPFFGSKQLNEIRALLRRA